MLKLHLRKEGDAIELRTGGEPYKLTRIKPQKHKPRKDEVEIFGRLFPQHGEEPFTNLRSIIPNISTQKKTEINSRADINNNVI